ncbi:unnamed protein product, partial [Aphanomyces euteiches]
NIRICTTKTKTKRLTKRDLEARLAQYEEASIDKTSVAVAAPVELKSIETTTNKVYWTVEMVRTLLELRLQRYAAGFQASRSNQQLSLMWEKIAMSLNLACSTAVPALSVKSKYHSLKNEFSKIRFQEQSTGNDVDDPIIYPIYWDDLVEYLGDKSGLGHNEFASSIDLGEPIENSLDDVLQAKRARLEKQKKEKKERRHNTTSVADGLASLGQTLAKGLVDAAVATPRPIEEKMNALLEAIQDTKKVQEALLENITTNNAIQAQ